MRSILLVALAGLALGRLADAQTQIDRSEIERDCGTNTGSTAFEACLLAKYREINEGYLNERYERILAYLRKEGRDEAADLFVKAQVAWVAYRKATCELENESGGINSIGWARCFARMREERMAYFDEHYDWPALYEEP